MTRPGQANTCSGNRGADVSIVPTPETDRARFWAKVDKLGPIPEHRPELGPCWLWTAALYHDSGYGAFRLNRRQRRAHTVAFEWYVGPLDGLMVCHHCDVRHCVRPDHLFLGTAQANLDDAVAKGRMATGLQNPMHAHGLTTLTEAQVREIHALCSGGAPQQAVADPYGVTQTLVSHILRGERWGHLDLPVVRAREKKSRPSPETVRAVREMGTLGIPYPEIGRLHDLSTTAVWRIVRRLAYQDIE